MTVASSMAPYPTKPLNKQEVWGWKRGGLSLEGKDDYKGWEHWSKWYVSLILFSAFREKLFRDSSEIFEFIPCEFLLFEPGHHAGKSGVGEGKVVLKARRGEECGNGGFMQRLSTKLKYYSWHPPRVSESDWAEKKYLWEWLKLQRKTQKMQQLRNITTRPFLQSDLPLLAEVILIVCSFSTELVFLLKSNI